MAPEAALKRILKNDKRRAPRLTCDMDASIRPIGSFKTKDCRVLDVSDLGVRLTADNSDKIPDRFLFFLNKSGMGREASVRWRRGNQVGAELGTVATSQANTKTDKTHASLLASAAIAVILLISMYELAGIWGAINALSAILIFAGLRAEDFGTH